MIKLPNKGELVSQNELQNGDHIFAWRRRYKVEYAHHGIYDADAKRVIDFGEPKSSDESGVIAPKVKQALGPPVLKASAALLKVRSDYRNATIRRSSLKNFASKEGKFIVYRYGFDVHQSSKRKKKKSKQDNVNSGSCPGLISVTDTTRRDAIKIARWFVSHKDAFGRYNLDSWNCENFATFCHTTSLGEQQLEAEYQKRKRQGDLGKFRYFLRENSKSISLQTEHFKGSDIFFHSDLEDTVEWFGNPGTDGVDEFDGEAGNEGQLDGDGDASPEQDSGEEAHETMMEDDNVENKVATGEQVDSGYKGDDEESRPSEDKEAGGASLDCRRRPDLVEQQANEDDVDTKIGDTSESVVDGSKPDFPSKAGKQMHSDDEDEEAVQAPRKWVKAF